MDTTTNTRNHANTTINTMERRGRLIKLLAEALHCVGPSRTHADVEVEHNIAARLEEAIEQAMCIDCELGAED